jgi:hypothetical protein
MKECGKEREDGKNVKLRDTKQFRWMKIVPMPELVCCMPWFRNAHVGEGEDTYREQLQLLLACSL